MAQKQEKAGTIVLRMSDVRPMTMHVWICPHCGYVVAEFSPAKALSAAKLHLERKHYLEVVVEGEAEKKQTGGNEKSGYRVTSSVLV
jgi:uncharacterized protein (DUF2225 family)